MENTLVLFCILSPFCIYFVSFSVETLESIVPCIKTYLGYNRAEVFV